MAKAVAGWRTRGLLFRDACLPWADRSMVGGELALRPGRRPKLESRRKRLRRGRGEGRGQTRSSAGPAVSATAPQAACASLFADHPDASLQRVERITEQFGDAPERKLRGGTHRTMIGLGSVGEPTLAPCSARPARQLTSQIAPSRTSTGKVFSGHAPVVALTAPASGLNAPWGPRTILPVTTS